MDVSELVRNIEEATNIDERRNAIEDLINAEQTNDEVLKILTEYLKEEDRGLRDVCSRFFINLDEEYKALAASYVVKLISLTNITIRNLAGDILMSYGYTAVSILMPYLSDDNMDVRKYALDIIGVNGCELELDYIYTLIDDTDKNVRASVFEAAGNICAKLEIDNPEHLEYLQNAAIFLIENFDKEEDNKVFIIEALAKMGVETSEDFLIKVMNEEEDFFLQIACIDALALKCMRMEVAQQLMETIGSFDQMIQPIILKTINAISFRLGGVVALPDELRFIAHNGLLDDNEDIRMSGILSLSEVIQYRDISFLSQIYGNLNYDIQSYVLRNIILNSEEGVIELFLNEYLQLALSSSLINKDLELISVIVGLSDEISKVRCKVIYSRIIDIVVRLAKGSSQDVVEYILRYDHEAVIEKLRSMLKTSSIDELPEVLELIIQLQLSELKEQALELQAIDNHLIVEKLKIITNNL